MSFDNLPPDEMPGPPVRRPGRPRSDWPEQFLLAYAITGNITAAANAAGVDRRTVQMRRARSKMFAEACAMALEEAYDRLEMEAHRRAVHGIDKPVFYKGERCGEVREYSDTLLALLMRAARPEKFRDRASIEHSGPEGGAIPIKEVIVSMPSLPLEPGVQPPANEAAALGPGDPPQNLPPAPEPGANVDGIVQPDGGRVRSVGEFW